MTKQQNVTDLVQTGQATPIPTRQGLLNLAAEAISRDRNGRKYRNIKDIEGMSLDQLRAHSTEGTVLEPVERAFADRGFKTNGTVGGIMDIVALTQEEVHATVCYCNEETDYVDGCFAQAGFTKLAKES